MRVFLASTNEGVTKETRKALINKGRPLYILETFFNGEKKCKIALNDVGPNNFLLDSGAFSFMSGAECSKDALWQYAERYADFINQHGVNYYFELDVDTIYGIEFVEEVRNMLEQKTGKPCIPVWHKGRGVEYYKKMVSQYEYIAIGGLVFHVKKQELPFVKKMVSYAYRKGVKVHGLGFTKVNELEGYKWFSVDSASWTKAGGRGRQMYTFKNGQLTHHKIEGNGRKIELTQLILHNGIEWCKYQRYMDLKRW